MIMPCASDDGPTILSETTDKSSTNKSKDLLTSGGSEIESDASEGSQTRFPLEWYRWVP